MMAYLLDANVFIEAKNRYYGFDLCPGFWDWLEVAHADSHVWSIEKVRAELVAGEDELAEWARDQPESFFPSPDEAVLRSLREVSAWVNSARYVPAAVTTFLEGADFYLVAHARAYGLTVVTHERITDSIKKVKIPDACIALGVKYVNTFEMLRAEKARFVLPDKRAA